MDLATAAQLIAGICTVMSVILSVQLISLHLRHWHHPEEQKLIIYIILMVPLFAIDSFIGLLEIRAAEWIVMILDSVKECYEAFVLNAFIRLMFSLVEVSPDGSKLPEHLKGRHIHHSFPFNYFMSDMDMSAATVRQLELWTTQFIFLRPILSIVSVVAQLTGHYDTIYFTVSLILNVSVTMAVYSLMLFYHAFHHELRSFRPLAKFLSIKGVVFFSFWQGVVVEMLVYVGIIHKQHWYTVNELEVAIQNFLVCVEMGLIFAVAHSYAFNVDDYRDKKRLKKKQ